MLETARKLFALLDRRDCIQLALLFVAVLGMAFLQMASIAAVLPFLSVAANPGLVTSNAWLSWAFETGGFTSANNFLVALGSGALLALVISNAWMAATQWAQYRFVRGRTHALSTKLLKHYLFQPYVYFLRRNSGDLSKNVLAEVEQVTGGVLMPGLQLVTRAMVALVIVALLVALDPFLALLVTTVLGGLYGIFYIAVRRTLAGLGASRVAANTARYVAAGEALGAIKDVKLLGKEESFLSRFRKASSEITATVARAQIISDLPRYALETIAFGGVLLIALYLILRGDALQQVIPVLGLYAFAGYRLMPCLQQIFQALSKLRFGAAALENLHKELLGLGTQPVTSRSNGQRPSLLPLYHRLELEELTFTYPGAEAPTLKGITLSISANDTVGIMGPSGSGKTTLVDVILGLLRPEQGTLLVDGTPLTEHNLRAWQATLGYVPQHIYLSDESIAANIAFGVPPAEIDMKAVQHAARLAQIHEFVMSDLPERYWTVVGERGVRLSGGQRQRIGIARALYHDPALLVLDEATSSLDPETEAGVMAAIASLSGTRTILIIAHRESSLQGCDDILWLDSGRLMTQQPASGAGTWIAGRTTAVSCNGNSEKPRIS